VTGLLGYRPVLIVTAVEPERAAVLAGLAHAGSPGPAPGSAGAASAGAAWPGTARPGATLPEAVAVVAVVGVGPALAAATTARLLARAECDGRPYEAVICAGIAGGFAGRVEVGRLAVATESIAADLGADSPEGFVGLDQLGFGTAHRPAALGDGLRRALPESAAGPILTVSTVTGTAAGTTLLSERYPDAVAEGMEGFGVACAAGELPFGEIRAISNVIGPRYRAAWRIAPALAALETAFRRLGGVTLEP
jgi:futalosine hydrolase